MRLPTVILEGKKLPRVIFSIRPQTSLGHEKIPSLMKKVYGRDVWYYDLPSMKHVEHFRELKQLTEDESLTGLCHVEA